MKPAAGENLDGLLVEIRACRVCITDPRGPPLPHEPRPILRATSTARVAICGQAPGLRVHHSGVPFSDPSGERLRAWMGVTPAEFYDETRVAIVPMGFCFPGYGKSKTDLPPRRECAPLWRARVFAALPQLELLLLVGSHAIGWHLPERRRQPMTDTVASWAQILNERDGHRAVFPLPHPSWRNSAWLKANPWFDADAIPVLQARVRSLLR